MYQITYTYADYFDSHVFGVPCVLPFYFSSKILHLTFWKIVAEIFCVLDAFSVTRPTVSDV